MMRAKTLGGRYESLENLCFEAADILEGKELARERRIFPESQEQKVLSAQKELNFWLIRMGLAPEAGLPVSRIGIYTDFT